MVLEPDDLAMSMLPTLQRARLINCGQIQIVKIEEIKRGLLAHCKQL